MKITINKTFSLASDDSMIALEKMSNVLNDDTVYITEVIKPELLSVKSNLGTSGVSRTFELKEEQSWFDFLKEWKEEGFWHAMYDRSFAEVMADSFKEIGIEIGKFIVNNADLFFLMPSILVLFATFFIGRNKYTKYTLPLVFAYFVTRVLGRLYM